MKQSNVSFLKKTIRNHITYDIFLLLILIFVFANYLETFDADIRETYLVPRFVLIMMAILIGAQFLIQFIEPLMNEYEFVSTRNSNDPVYKDNQNESKDVETESETVEVTVDSVKPILRDLIFVSIYLASINYVGFFTSTFIFTFSYIYINTDVDTLQAKGRTSLIWAIGFVIILYIMFILILGKLTLLRFGMLP